MIRVPSVILWYNNYDNNTNSFDITLDAKYVFALHHTLKYFFINSKYTNTYIKITVLMVIKNTVIYQRTAITIIA